MGALTRDEIWQTAEELKKCGMNISAKRIRETLNRGSLTTISKHLKAWKEQDVVDDEDLTQILASVSDEVISEFFANEHPQIVALVMSHLAPRRAAAILKTYHSDMRDSLLDRMENLDFVQKDIVELLAKTLKSELASIHREEFLQIKGKSLAKSIREELR